MKQWIQKELRTGRWKRARDLYARLILENGYPLSSEQMDALQEVYRADRRSTIKQVLRNPIFMNDVVKAMGDILRAEGRMSLSKQFDLLEQSLLHYEMAAADKASEGDHATAAKLLNEAVTLMNKYTNLTMMMRKQAEGDLRADAEHHNKLAQDRLQKLLDEREAMMEDAKEVGDE